MVSEATAGNPCSNIERVERCESFTVNPSARQNVVQNGMVSQNASTRGMPMVTPRGSAIWGAG